jgi:uncharacterized membrane protein HdeD (DUF308 family)
MEAQEGASIADDWIWVVFRGLVIVLFGLLAFARPSATTLALVLALGTYVFAGGAAAVATSLLRGRAGARGDVLLLDGLMGVGIAIVSLLWPARVTITFVWVFGAWAIATGAMELTHARRLRRVLHGEWSLDLAGATSVAFGFFTLVRPLAGGHAMLGSLGAYGLAFGLATIAFGLRLRSSFAQARGSLPRALG